jgi:hypothetical protein
MKTDDGLPSSGPADNVPARWGGRGRGRPRPAPERC